MTTFKERYERAKDKLLTSGNNYARNRKLFGNSLSDEEYKLQRQNDLDFDNCATRPYVYTQTYGDRLVWQQAVVRSYA
jgi:hypothetical protein